MFLLKVTIGASTGFFTILVVFDEFVDVFIVEATDLWEVFNLLVAGLAIDLVCIFENDF
jgi:hypothetical protein